MAVKTTASDEWVEKWVAIQQRGDNAWQQHLNDLRQRMWDEPAAAHELMSINLATRKATEEIMSSASTTIH
jgi:hypothetical protein